MTGLRASFSFSSIDARNVETARGEHSVIHIEGAYPTGNVGELQLPMLTRLIAIPTGATPVVTLDAYSETEYSLSDYGIGTITAMQAPVRYNPAAGTVKVFNDIELSVDFQNGEGELQMFDLMGRMIARYNVNGEETVGKPSQTGVYILRIVGKEIRVQKIVVR